MFGSFGLFEGLLVLAVSAFVLRRGALSASGPTLVLRKFAVSFSGSPAVLIEGRASGLMAWLLTTVGLDTLTTLVVTDTQLSIKSAGLSGEIHQFVSLSRISSTHCAYTQPVWLLVTAATVIVLSLLSATGRYGGAGTVLSGIVIAGILAGMYWFQRKIAITIETSGGLVMGLSFQPSAIEMVSVNLQQATAAVERINSLVLGSAPGANAEDGPLRQPETS